MGKRGPLPKKKVLRVLSGKLPVKKCNGIEGAVITKFEPPDQPKDLSAAEKKIWDITVEVLRPLRVLEKIDGAVLAAYCCTYVRWREAESEIRKMQKQRKILGLISPGANGNVVTNPLINISRNERASLLAFAAQLGMTPAARMRVQVVEREPRENPFRKLRDQKNVDMGTAGERIRPGVNSQDEPE